MTKFCFLVPDIEIAKVVVDEIRGLGIPDDRIHAIANDSTDLESLPEADGIEDTDIVGGAARGAVVGSATGMLAGLLAVVVPQVGIVAAGSALAAGAVGGAGFGVWIGSVVGASVPNSQLDEWKEEIDRGNILILVEASEDEEAGVKGLLQKYKLQVIASGEKGDIPVL